MVREAANLVKGKAVAFSFGKVSAGRSAIVSGYSVGRVVLVGPGDFRAFFNRDAFRAECKIANRNANCGLFGRGRRGSGFGLWSLSCGRAGRRRA